MYLLFKFFSYDLIKRTLELTITAITDCLCKIRINFTQMSENMHIFQASICFGLHIGLFHHDMLRWSLWETNYYLQEFSILLEQILLLKIFKKSLYEAMCCTVHTYIHIDTEFWQDLSYVFTPAERSDFFWGPEFHGLLLRRVKSVKLVEKHELFPSLGYEFLPQTKI